MEHKGTQILHIKHFTLHPFRLEDAQDMFHNRASDPAVVKHLTWPVYKSADTALIDHLFREVGTVDNPASSRVMEKFGMVQNSRILQAYQCNDGIKNVSCCAIHRG